MEARSAGQGAFAEPARDEPEEEADDGLSHHGGPDVELPQGELDELPEVEVLEGAEARKEPSNAPKVVRVPRIPTQKERDEHEATHLPHADWCEFRMKGRGRNKPHYRRKGADEGPGPGA